MNRRSTPEADAQRAIERDDALLNLGDSQGC